MGTSAYCAKDAAFGEGGMIWGSSCPKERLIQIIKNPRNNKRVIMGT
ncbi:MAG: hypothetical protein TRG1_1003 [Flavobacteriaceae bacterium FS1-H7996/R]|nr:MAG: hypothetical protein TRG1_1003 [Flavobacteriaceae bacterium FS1-H7996/R]